MASDRRLGAAVLLCWFAMACQTGRTSTAAGLADGPTRWLMLPDELRQDILSKGQLDRIRSTMRALRELRASNPQ